MGETPLVGRRLSPKMRYLLCRYLARHFDWSRFLCAEPAVDNPAQDRANDRGHPKEPELAKRPAACEQRGARAASWIDRGVGHRDADQVNQRQAQTNGDRCESPGRAT